MTFILDRAKEKRGAMQPARRAPSRSSASILSKCYVQTAIAKTPKSEGKAIMTIACNNAKGGVSAFGLARAAQAAVAGLAMLAAGTAAAGAAMPDLFQGNAASACFTHKFDAAQLEKNPKQTVQSVVLSFVKTKVDGTVEVRVQFVKKGDSLARSAAGACAWMEKPVTASAQKHIDAGTTAGDGFSCSAVIAKDGSSDVEGGDFAVDGITDGKQLVLRLPDQIAVWPGMDQSKNADFTPIGADDQTLQLEKAPATECSAIEKGLTVVVH